MNPQITPESEPQGTCAGQCCRYIQINVPDEYVLDHERARKRFGAENAALIPLLRRIPGSAFDLSEHPGFYNPDKDIPWPVQSAYVCREHTGIPGRGCGIYENRPEVCRRHTYSTLLRTWGSSRQRIGPHGYGNCGHMGCQAGRVNDTAEWVPAPPEPDQEWSKIRLAEPVEAEELTEEIFDEAIQAEPRRPRSRRQSVLIFDEKEVADAFVETHLIGEKS